MSGSKMRVKWSELCPELMPCVLEQLSFTDLNRAKLVCSSWYSASKGCLPKENQIPWLILFPRKDEDENRCVLFVPDDTCNVYRTRDFGVGFMRSRCLATYGSWLLMMDIDHRNLNILNPLTGERIDLPVSDDLGRRTQACLWIDERSKDYMVVCSMMTCLVFNKKGNQTWRQVSNRYFTNSFGEQLVYEHKAQTLYVHCNGCAVKAWCLSGDDPQVLEDIYPPVNFTYWDFLSKDPELYLKEEEVYVKGYLDHRLNIAVSTTSGDVLKVASAVQKSKRWLFCVSKMHPIKLTWEVVDSLGDEALILDMGITVVAKNIPGIKRNSIYFSGYDYGRKNPDHIFVFDLATHEVEPLPEFVFSSIRFSEARWFFPGLSS